MSAIGSFLTVRCHETRQVAPEGETALVNIPADDAADETGRDHTEGEGRGILPLGVRPWTATLRHRPPFGHWG